MPDLRISVVTPCYNSEDYIEDTIKSVLAQGYSNLEYIVIDGGSTDRTVDIIRKYESEISFWISEKDNGQYDAINKGMARATGDILCWLNADDLFLKSTLSIVNGVFSTHGPIEWISTLKPVICDATGHTVQICSHLGFARDAFADGLFLDGYAPSASCIQQESTFWRRSIWERAGGRITDADLAGDFALWCAFYAVGHLHGVDYPLSQFRRRPGQRSEDYDRYRAEAITFLDAYRKRTGWNGDSVMSLRSKNKHEFMRVFPDRYKALSYNSVKVFNAAPNAAAPVWDTKQYNWLP
jgi:glycosyltransferase involved in cell wall biosynthesis